MQFANYTTCLLTRMNIDHFAYYEIKLIEESLSYYISKNTQYNINKHYMHYHPKGFGMFLKEVKAAFI